MLFVGSGKGIKRHLHTDQNERQLFAILDVISVSRRLIDWKKALIWGKTQREVGEPDVFIVRFCIVCHLVFQLFSVFGWFGLTAGDKLSVFLNVKDRGFCL